MPVRIAVDVRRIGDFGFGTYIRNLLRGLAEVDQSNQYALISARTAPEHLPALPDNFELKQYDGSDRQVLTQFTYPMFLRSLGADVYHIPLNAVPLFMPRPYVVTIHDMASLIFNSGSGLRHGLRTHRFRRGLVRAARVIAVSNATRRDVENFLSIPTERIRTVYNAPDPIFTEPSVQPVACVGEGDVHYPPEMQRILDRYQINYPYLLYAGRINRQKNIPRLVEAFSVVRAELEHDPLYRDLRLIIIGDEISKFPPLRQAVIQSRVEHAVRFLGFVPIDTLRVVYQAAAAFVFPSLYEGFGLPPLEAMACGTPVICSNISSLPEVVGDAALVVNPENVFDIARGIRDALTNTSLRAELVRKGFERLANFSWRRSAAQVLESYLEVAKPARTG